ncbi:MAG: tetratricopeptide repeat protein [bacterium]
MDPISREINRFQETFRDFRENTNARILHIITQPELVNNIIKALRAEEWQPDNRCPFLIFNTDYTDGGAACEEMRMSLIEHYNLLRKGLAQENVYIPEFNVSFKGDPYLVLAMHIQEFYKNIRETFDGLFACWLPASIGNRREWQKFITQLLKLPFDPNIRFIVADDGNDQLEKEFKKSNETLVTTNFYIDNKEVMNYFRKLMSSGESNIPPSVPGVPPGAARPDVAPPPRRVGPRQPTDEEIQAAVKATGVQPVLTPSESDKLRKLIFDAAMASGEGRVDEAIRLQQSACKICHDAGVVLEETLMTMVLATYHQQAKQKSDAIKQYKYAEILAIQIEAYQQVTQIHMSLAYIYLMDKLNDMAALEYEKAADSANKAGDAIMQIEALRMAGMCYLQNKDRDQAERCWRKAIDIGKTAEPAQIRLSSFMDVASALIELLQKMKLKEQAQAIEVMVMKVGEKTRFEQEEHQ